MALFRTNSRIDFGDPITRGLAFAHLPGKPGSPLFNKRGSIATPNYSASTVGPRTAAGGAAMGGTAGYWGGTSASNAFNVNQNEGTILVVAQTAFATASLPAVTLFGNGYANYATGPTVEMTTNAGNWLFGWWSAGTDTRIGSSITGSYVPGKPFTAAYSWNKTTGVAGQKAYVSGKQIVTSGTAPTTGDTSGAQFSIGNNTYASSPFITAVGDFIYAAYVWDRQLTADEIARIEDDPTCFLVQPPGQIFGSASANVTVALTGVSATYSAGTLTPSSTVALSGQSATYSQGTVTPSATVALSGAAGTYAQGTVTPGTATALSGAAATYAQGDLTPSLTTALSGQSATYQQGDVSVAGDKTVALTGVSATYSQGTLTVGTGGTDTHDGWIRQRHYARTLAKIAEERRRATVEEARAIRAEIQAVIEDAADVPATPAVKTALNAVNRAAPARTAEASTAPQIAGMGDLRALHRALDALAQAVAYEKMIDDDDEEVFLLI